MHAHPTKTGWEEIAPQVQRFVHTWEAAGTAQAALCIVHGLGEHGGRYHSLATDLAASGLHVVAFDQQGHGQSPGRRAQIASYPSLLHDIHLMLTW